jgi:CubicO group peptidase (beta-lactamase class C family)
MEIYSTVINGGCGAIQQGSDKPITWAGAFGNGGQRAWVVPSAELVVIVTTGLYDAPEADTVVRQIFTKYVLPAVEG